MAKDPAVLFYTSDFLSGTRTMKHEEVGMYITLLCLQHQYGKLSEEDMLSICYEYREKIFSKFEKIDGYYYNKRMMEESVKRSKYTESRRNNAKVKHKQKDMQEHMPEHMENENENINDNINKDKVYRKFDHLKITQSEFNILNKTYSKDKIDSVLDSIQNYRANKKYVSLYLTAVKWLKKENKSTNQMVY